MADQGQFAQPQHELLQLLHQIQAAQAVGGGDGGGGGGGVAVIAERKFGDAWQVVGPVDVTSWDTDAGIAQPRAALTAAHPAQAAAVFEAASEQDLRVAFKALAMVVVAAAIDELKQGQEGDANHLLPSLFVLLHPCDGEEIAESVHQRMTVDRVYNHDTNVVANNLAEPRRRRERAALVPLLLTLQRELRSAPSTLPDDADAEVEDVPGTIDFRPRNTGSAMYALMMKFDQSDTLDGDETPMQAMRKYGDKMQSLLVESVISATTKKFDLKDGVLISVPKVGKVWFPTTKQALQWMLHELATLAHAYNDVEALSTVMWANTNLQYLKIRKPPGWTNEEFFVGIGMIVVMDISFTQATEAVLTWGGVQTREACLQAMVYYVKTFLSASAHWTEHKLDRMIAQLQGMLAAGSSGQATGGSAAGRTDLAAELVAMQHAMQRMQADIKSILAGGSTTGGALGAGRLPNDPCFMHTKPGFMPTHSNAQCRTQIAQRKKQRREGTSA